MAEETNDNEAALVTIEATAIPAVPDKVSDPAPGSNDIQVLYSQLTPREVEFISEYLRNGYCAKKAVEVIDEDIKEKYPRSDVAIRSAGSYLLQGPRVQAYLKAYFESIRIDNAVHTQQLIEELNRWAFCEPKNKEEMQLKLQSLNLLHKTLGLDRKGAVTISDPDGRVIRVEYV